MADASARQKPAVTPRQVLLIAVLGLILAVVLIVQFGGATGRPEEGQRGLALPSPVSGAAQPAGSQTAAGARAAVAPASGAKTAPAGARSAGPPWPKLSGQTAAHYDPFAMPEPLARQALAQSQDNSRDGKAAPARRNPASDPALAALRSKGTSAVLRDRSGAVAVIDNRVVRVGDVLQGYRVISIDDDGVLLAPSGSQDVREDRK